MNVNITDESGATPLHYAAFYGHTEVKDTVAHHMVDLLAVKVAKALVLQSGGHCRVNATKLDGATPLHMAALAGTSKGVVTSALCV